MKGISGNEKLPLVQPRTLPQRQTPAPKSRGSWTHGIWILLSVAALTGWCTKLLPHKGEHPSSSPHLLAQCPQVKPLFPSQKSDALAKMDDFLQSSKFRNETVARMSGAIQIPTQSYDDMGIIGEDKRWDAMFELAAYLEKTFPLVHSTLQLEKVNTHGLLFTWTGSDESLKPTVLMAHQDVVPVAAATANTWTYPPFSGFYDGKHIWGRGASDCKNTLVGILEAVELLVEAGFKPKRTLVLSFGFDEEISGMEGAGHLAPFLLDRYGKNGVSIIVDEGSGVTSAWGSTFSLPGVAEKGYIDVDVIVRMPGGHSSVPPPHNGIGVMGELITAIEANPYVPHFHDENPYLGLMQCGAQYSPAFPPKLKKALKKYKEVESCGKTDKLALEAAKAGDMVKYLFTTSVAADLISGGVKTNALPERTVLTVNHRVNVGDHPSDVRAKITEVVAPIAQKFNLTLHAFDEEGETPRSITLKDPGATLDVAPVTPTSIDGVTPYGVLSGTTRAMYGEKMLMAPGIMTGNTDTRYYWDLTQHIFRYVAGYEEGENILEEGIHTVDERVSVLAHIRNVQWFTMFVRNMDEADMP